MKALGVAHESEFAGDVWKQVRHGEFAADAGDIDDGGVAIEWGPVEQVRKSRLGGVESGEEVGCHGASVSGDGLVFDGSNFNDTGVVDEDVDVAEEAYRVVDEHCCLCSVGEIGGQEEDVVGMFDGFVREEGLASFGEFVGVSRDEDEFGAGAAEAVRQGKAEAAGATGDKDDTTAVAFFRARH